jgi:hypothetical protein
MGGGSTVLISLPYNASTSARDRFSRLRAGDYVRVEGRFIAQHNLQLERFY